MHAMSESLLGLSEVLLFGREVEDLQIPDRPFDHSAKVATTIELDAFEGDGPIDTIDLEAGDTVLVHLQKNKTQNGLYIVQDDNDNTWDKIGAVVEKGKIVYVTQGEDYGDTFWEQLMPMVARQKFKEVPRRGGRGRGRNNQLDDQLGGDAQFARIYGFSYEGTYYELPNPTLFLVHGTGVSATDGNQPKDRFGDDFPDKHASRAPIDPSVSGVAAADFQFADDIRVWAYDKADYTIRMDVETGMFEQVLLDVFFGVEAPMLAGGRVAGGRVAGGRVAGGRVAGGRVAGGRVSGGRVGGASD